MFNFFNEIISDYGLENNLLNSFNIINMSNKIVYIEGQKGLFSISSTKISILVKNLKINILGENLVVKKITETTITVMGKIKQIESIV
ncbi:MAG: YabP/YqfC family sporulation protein [Clostridia bacterium]|nr:YabP/YqfC family sporulation protein [Clostridia bacterium]